MVQLGDNAHIVAMNESVIACLHLDELQKLN